MVDVLHYFFEEDATRASTAEQSDAIDAIRTQMYLMFYDRTYKYAKSSVKATDYSNLDEPFETEEMPVAFDPIAQRPKPYTPSTDFNPDSSKPFGSVLDAPLK